MSGWKVVGEAPKAKHCIIIGAPHTSNWDFIRFVGIRAALGLEPAFIGKHTLFKGVMDNFMRELGGIPVDRSSPRDAVQQVVDQFAAHKASGEEFRLVLSPEGTRKAVGKWKTGFYRMAELAGVPIVCGYLDHENKVLGIGPEIPVTGDYRADMAKIVDFYAQYFPVTLAEVLGEEPAA